MIQFIKRNDIGMLLTIKTLKMTNLVLRGNDIAYFWYTYKIEQLYQLF